MVVAQVVRIQNSTLRTFKITAGDLFYSPQVDGVPSADGVIEVPPGFDQPTQGLLVSWESLTTKGLVIEEADQFVRCVIGPVEDDHDNRDWLQFRTADWEPLMKGRWLPMGRRHILGTVGNAVELQITFRDGATTTQESTLLDITRFERAVKAAPKNTVFLNIFDLAGSFTVANAMLCNTVYNTLGAFHAAVEVHGEEWAFYRTPNANSCGVYRSSRPRYHPIHVFRQSINLGTTELKDWEVSYLIRAKLASKWPGGLYHLLQRNCIHFCDELTLMLGVQSVPSWVKGLHETAASVLQIPWPLSALFGGEVKPKNVLKNGERTDCANGAVVTASSARKPILTDDDQTSVDCDNTSSPPADASPVVAAVDPRGPWLHN